MPIQPTKAAFADSIDPDRARRILAQRTRALAMRGQARATPAEAVGRRVMACQVGSELYGLDIAAVAAVMPMGRYVRLPAAPPAVLGLIGRAGRIYSVIDLGTVLGLSGEAPGAGEMLVLRRDVPRVALRVSRVLGVATVAADAVAPPVSPHPGPVSAQLTLPPGTLGSAGMLLSLIDLDRLLRPFLSPLRPGDPSP